MGTIKENGKNQHVIHQRVSDKVNNVAANMKCGILT
jgi:hypothetical protein